MCIDGVEHLFRIARFSFSTVNIRTHCKTHCLFHIGTNLTIGVHAAVHYLDHKIPNGTFIYISYSVRHEFESQKGLLRVFDIGGCVVFFVLCGDHAFLQQFITMCRVYGITTHLRNLFEKKCKITYDSSLSI